MENQYQEFYPFSREPQVQREFRVHLEKTPIKRRMTAERKHDLIRWLSDSNAKPQDQREYSLRNHALKTFKLDGETHTLWSIGKPESEKPAKNGKAKKAWKSWKSGKPSKKCQDRMVVTEDEILNVVEQIHMSIDHGGWDATWDEVSSKYYGIVRSDVTFLLKRCYICTIKPRNQARRHAAPDEAPASTSSRPEPSSEQLIPQQSLQFYQQQVPEPQDFDQILDQHSQQTFDYNFGNDFESDSFQTSSFQTSSPQTSSFQTSSFPCGSFEGLNQLWTKEAPAEVPEVSHMPDFGLADVGLEDVDMANIDNIDPALLDNGFQNMSFSDFTYTYPFPEEVSGSDI
ncbi:hypothetical protein HDV63DRAFT_413458 [Trichoderma sp. SZMC 28014]